MNGPRIWSIGHSNHPLERLVALLLMHGIQSLADIRSVPWSRRLPQFRKRALDEGLAEAGIGYVHLGDSLGGRNKEIAAEDFAAGLDRLVALAGEAPTAMLCAEHDPAACHRARLTAPALEARGCEILHILRDGSLEPHTTTKRRLGGAQPDLFG